MTNTKRCPTCEEVKATAEFYCKRSRPDGLDSQCKSCVKAYSRSYGRDHREQRKEAWSAYYAENSDRLNASTRARYHEIKGDFLPALSTYRMENRAHFREIEKRWADANREKIRTKNNAYSERFRSAAGQHSKRDLERILQDQDWKCKYCRKSLLDGKHLDHWMPLSLGGSNDPSNLQYLCVRCSTRKGAKHPVEFERSIAPAA